jgi:hypothetical protein
MLLGKSSEAAAPDALAMARVHASGSPKMEGRFPEIRGYGSSAPS